MGPIALSEAAESELQEASRLSDAAVEAIRSGETILIDNSCGEATSRSGKGSVRFQNTLGILDVGSVKRHGVKCFHCQGPLDKGHLRFTFSHSCKKPARSIHVNCLVQMNEQQRVESVAQLQRMQHSTTDPEEQRAGSEALRVLRRDGNA